MKTVDQLIDIRIHLVPLCYLRGEIYYAECADNLIRVAYAARDVKEAYMPLALEAMRLAREVRNCGIWQFRTVLALISNVAPDWMVEMIAVAGSKYGSIAPIGLFSEGYEDAA
ncbi:hypothetical protein MR829_22920 [Paracoccus versutus]|uniref:hypothetical protein n=1 Tax=Paracoccus versutus TaxID=34007 RepID=UPI001FB63E73|nr:hypothetical protein [Paracoccus versutus]MCJ1903185.1 hypothetical protein [Paracoccus versutus]